MFPLRNVTPVLISVNPELAGAASKAPSARLHTGCDPIRRMARTRAMRCAPVIDGVLMRQRWLRLGRAVVPTSRAGRKRRICRAQLRPRSRTDKASIDTTARDADELRRSHARRLLHTRAQTAIVRNLPPGHFLRPHTTAAGASFLVPLRRAVFAQRALRVLKLAAPKASPAGSIVSTGAQ
jgi:hypothetical protein